MRRDGTERVRYEIEHAARARRALAGGVLNGHEVQLERPDPARSSEVPILPDELTLFIPSGKRLPALTGRVAVEVDLFPDDPQEAPERVVEEAIRSTWSDGEGRELSEPEARIVVAVVRRLAREGMLR